MTTLFDTEINKVFMREGWRSNHPDDAGGLTIWGITIRDYPDAVKQMEKMTPDESKDYAKVIFKAYYWDKAGCDYMPTAGQRLTVQLFDTAINMGVRRSVNLLQKSCNLFLFRKDMDSGQLAEDGRFGIKTENAVTEVGEKIGWDILAGVFLSARIQYYSNIVTSNKRQAVFIKGWIRRALECAGF